MNEQRARRRLVMVVWLMVMLAAVIFPAGGAAQGGTDPAGAEPGAPSAALANSMGIYAPRIAYYYKQPRNMANSELATKFGFFILAKGNESFRDNLLTSGARHPILDHVRAEAIHDPGSCTAMPWQNNVAFKVGDFCDISQNHPEWFLLDQNGQRIVDVEEGQDFYLMDSGNPEWQQFYISRVQEILLDPKWEGIFMDNVEVTLDFREQKGSVPQKYPTNEAYWAANKSLLQALSDTYFRPNGVSNGKLMYGNIVSRQDDSTFTDYIEYFDGVMFEGWTIDNPNRWRSPERVETHLDVAEQIQRMGKFAILVGQGARDDNELQTFAYANYLLVNQAQAAFRYGFNQSYNEAWWYTNYEIDLGLPLGPRYEVGDEWRRDFEHGCLRVNIVTHAVLLTTQCTAADQALRSWMPFVSSAPGDPWPPIVGPRPANP